MSAQSAALSCEFRHDATLGICGCDAHPARANASDSASNRITSRFSGRALTFVPWHFIYHRPLQPVVMHMRLRIYCASNTTTSVASNVSICTPDHPRPRTHMDEPHNDHSEAA